MTGTGGWGNRLQLKRQMVNRQNPFRKNIRIINKNKRTAERIVGQGKQSKKKVLRKDDR